MMLTAYQLREIYETYGKAARDVISTYMYAAKFLLDYYGYYENDTEDAAVNFVKTEAVAKGVVDLLQADGYVCHIVHREFHPSGEYVIVSALYRDTLPDTVASFEMTPKEMYNDHKSNVELYSKGAALSSEWRAKMVAKYTGPMLKLEEKYGKENLID